MSNSQNRRENEEVISETELLKLRFDYAWKWFDFHAKQRMQLFNFFLIVTGILINAYIVSTTSKLSLMSVLVCLFGSLQAFSFFIFDVRSRQLTQYAEDILEKLELDQLFPDSFSHPYVRNGRSLGLIRGETNTEMREGIKRRWSRNLLKIKFWIRSTEILAGCAFLIGLLVAITNL